MRLIYFRSCSAVQRKFLSSVSIAINVSDKSIGSVESFIGDSGVKVCDPKGVTLLKAATGLLVAGLASPES